MIYILYCTHSALGKTHTGVKKVHTFHSCRAFWPWQVQRPVTRLRIAWRNSVWIRRRRGLFWSTQKVYIKVGSNRASFFSQRQTRSPPFKSWQNKDETRSQVVPLSLYCRWLITNFNSILCHFSQLKMSESTHSTSDATSETMDSQEPLLDDNGTTPTITTNPSTPRSGSSMSAGSAAISY